MDLLAVMNVLRAVRKERGLRQVDIAEQTGMCQQEVSKHESGRFLTYRAVTRYADALGYDIELNLRERPPVEESHG